MCSSTITYATLAHSRQKVVRLELKDQGALGQEGAAGTGFAHVMVRRWQPQLMVTQRNGMGLDVGHGRTGGLISSSRVSGAAGRGRHLLPQGLDRLHIASPSPVASDGWPGSIWHWRSPAGLLFPFIVHIVLSCSVFGYEMQTNKSATCFNSKSGRHRSMQAHKAMEAKQSMFRDRHSSPMGKGVL